MHNKVNVLNFYDNLKRYDTDYVINYVYNVNKLEAMRSGYGKNNFFFTCFTRSGDGYCYIDQQYIILITIIYVKGLWFIRDIIQYLPNFFSILKV